MSNRKDRRKGAQPSSPSQQSSTDGPNIIPQKPLNPSLAEPTKPDKGESWFRKNLIALFAFGMTLINFGYLLYTNWKANKVAEYVSYANIVVKPRQSIFKEYTDEEYQKHKWYPNQKDDIHRNNMHLFTYYYRIFDSTKKFAITNHSEYDNLDTLNKMLNNPRIKGDNIGANKIHEPKFQIINNGQTPAKNFSVKVGVIQSSLSNEPWRPVSGTSMQDIPAHDSIFPIVEYGYPQNKILNDTIYFWLRMRYLDVLGNKIENNYYVGYDPISDFWLLGDTIRQMFGSRPFKDEMLK